MKNLLFIFLFCHGFKLFSMCKILLLPGNIGSHLIFFGRLAEELLSRDHNVVMVVGSKTTIPKEVLKLQNLTLKTFKQKSAPFTELKEYKEPLINSAFTQSVWDILNANGNLFKFHIRDGLFLLEDSELMQNISGEAFDFVILDYVIPPFLILPYKLGIPYSLIGLSPPLLARRQIYFPSFVPTPTSFYGDNMNFRQRFINFLHVIYFAYIQRPSNGQAIVSKYAPEKPVKGFTELISEASLFITIRDILFEAPRPSSPDVISMGNLMGRPSNPLPKQLEEFMSSSPYGVIVVSFGSWLDDLPSETLEKMLEAFGNVRQNILWKYNGDIPECVPKNVQIVNWFEQNDVLGHPKVKLFIAHGGLNSLIESVYHSIPLVLLPIGVDQYTNSVLAADRGIAVVLEIAKFTTLELTSAIEHVLTETSFAENAKTMSTIMQEMQESKVTNPAFWIEHVIKHGHTTVRSRAFELPWYQFFMLDIFGFSLLVLFVIKYLLFDCILHKFKCFCIVTFQRYKTRHRE